MPTTPMTHWVGFHVFVIALLAIELIYVRRHPGKIRATSIAATTLWVGAALLFSIFILRTMGGESATQYLAGYAIEEALSIDNLFVFLLLFRLFNISEPNQPKVLFWGVLGAIVMRGAFIAAGIGLLARFEWISYIFAAILLIASIRLVIPEDKKDPNHTPRWIKWLSKVHPVSLRQDHFFVIEDGRRMITVLFLALIAIEITDLVFALDSIPAVLSITRQPFIAYTSNIMAVMGLRSLYFLLIGMLATLRFLHYGLAAILAFAAIKMLGAHYFEVGPLTSLAIILTLLAVTVVLSLVRGRSSSKSAS
ncbi:tellurite resistance protein TerC [Edaphobacter aggregans]|uniref:Tellurite resistance protein TerC n=1 Tax=Edaphobacter aggregans TaxID=570835 RepID=A0A428MN15_9BACT|nr:TerC/Alx family metal homeostasis membrane protein [Edaphobacter aggregans]RSL18301.1 tellurite resistance protein TerC [Edaphobacter aggregans]